MMSHRSFWQINLRIPTIIGAVLLALILFGVWLAVAHIDRFVMQSYQTDMYSYAQTVERALEHNFIENDFGALEKVVHDLSFEPETRSIRILDIDGNVLASSAPGELNIRLSNDAPQCRPCHSTQANDVATTKVMNGSEINGAEGNFCAG